MFPCRGLEGDLILYHFQILAGRKAWILEEHLSHCYRCRKYLENLKKASRLVGEDPAIYSSKDSSFASFKQRGYH